MNIHLKNFFIRGLIFSGLGPVVAAIVYLILYLCNVVGAVSGVEMFLHIISTYILAFVAAGASVVYNIERFSIMKATVIHYVVLYAAYILCYLINGWIKDNIKSILIFTIIFIVSYFTIWISTYFSIKAVSNKLNEKLANR